MSVGVTQGDVYRWSVDSARVKRILTHADKSIQRGEHYIPSQLGVHADERMGLSVTLTCCGQRHKASAVSSNLLFATGEFLVHPPKGVVAGGHLSNRSIAQIQCGGSQGAKKMTRNRL